VHRVFRVGLDPIAGWALQLRGGRHLTAQPGGVQRPGQAEPGRVGLVGNNDRTGQTGQPPQDLAVVEAQPCAEHLAGYPVDRATTEWACTSRPTLVRSVNTGTSGKGSALPARLDPTGNPRQLRARSRPNVRWTYMPSGAPAGGRRTRHRGVALAPLMSGATTSGRITGPPTALTAALPGRSSAVAGRGNRRHVSGCGRASRPHDGTRHGARGRIWAGTPAAPSLSRAMERAPTSAAGPAACNAGTISETMRFSQTKIAIVLQRRPGPPGLPVLG